MLAKATQSAAHEGQPERSHLLAVANQQEVTDEYRVVPGLSLDRREPHEFRELVGESPLPARTHPPPIVPAANPGLTTGRAGGGLASALPLAFAVLEVDAREAAAGEAEGMALVNDALCRDDRDDHQHDGADAVGPRRPAEE
jgi:hypothetical protein